MAAFELNRPTKVKTEYVKKKCTQVTCVMIYEPGLFCFWGTLYNEKQYLGQKCRKLQAC